MCLRGTPTTSITIHPNNNAAISKSEVDSVSFEFFCVISEDFISGIHAYLHKMFSRSSVPPINTTPHPSPDVSMNDIYSGSPVIS